MLSPGSACSSTKRRRRRRNRAVTYHLDLKRVIRRKLTMAIADGRMEVDGREIYTAKDLRVGMFTSTDDF